MSQKVSLVLSGGGARGTAHIGVIEELEKRGYEISSITGTSMGALIGGVYALGELDEFKSWICSLDKIKVFQLVDFTFSSQGLVKGDRVLNKIQEFVPDTNIQDLPIPYAAVSVDLLHRKEVVFREGSIFEAIRASISIPTVFTPIEKDGMLLVDGGLMNNIPVNHAKRNDGDLLIAVNVNGNVPLEKPILSIAQQDKNESIYRKRISEFQRQLHNIIPKTHHGDKLGYFDLINETIGLMTHHIAQNEIDKNPPDLMIDVSRDACGTYDFFKSKEQVEIGRTAAIKYLNQFES